MLKDQKMLFLLKLLMVMINYQPNWLKRRSLSKPIIKKLFAALDGHTHTHGLLSQVSVLTKAP